jgi:hypothetical protein
MKRSGTISSLLTCLRRNLTVPPYVSLVFAQIITRIYHIKWEGIPACIAELVIRKGFVGTLMSPRGETHWVKAKTTL